MRRLLDITLLSIFFIYFASNLLINIIAVPLAAYHSHEAWKETDMINHSEFLPKSENQKQSNREIKVEHKDSLSRTVEKNETKK